MKKIIAALLVAAALPLTSCVVAVRPPRPGMVLVEGVWVYPPRASAVWIPGHWNRVSYRSAVWVPGHWRY